MLRTIRLVELGTCFRANSSHRNVIERITQANGSSRAKRETQDTTFHCILKTLVSNLVGCDVEPSVTLTMVTVMLGSEVVKVFVRHS